MSILKTEAWLHRLYNTWSIDEAINLFMDHGGQFCSSNRHGIYLRHPSAGPERSEVRGVSEKIVVDYERFGRAVDSVFRLVQKTHAPSTESMAFSTGWRESELYQSVCAKYGTAHIMTAPVLGAGGLLIGTLQFGRTDSLGAFQESEIARAQALSLHLSLRISTLITLIGCPRFTRREAEIVACLVAGKSTAQMAAELHISVHAVRQAIKRLFIKHGVHSRSQIVALALSGRIEN